MGKEFSPRQKLETAAQKLELPQDLVAGLTRIEVLGSGELTIENHRGIRSFGENLLELATPQGRVVIEGRNLYIRRMSGEEVVVAGSFDALRFDGGEP